MTRRILTTTIALGALITLLGFSGIYAVFTDRATTGATGGTSDQLPGGADIEIARALSAVSCPAGDFDDDLVGDLIQWVDAKPGDDLGNHYFCVRNVGVADVDLTWTVIDTANTELACTGDEASVDGSCGSGLGELGLVLYLSSQKYDCATGAADGGFFEQFVYQGANVAFLAIGDTLTPSETVCLRINTSYPAYDNGTTVAEAQAAQSDQISWRFAFDATEAP